MLNAGAAGDVEVYEPTLAFREKGVLLELVLERGHGRLFFSSCSTRRAIRSASFSVTRLLLAPVTISGRERTSAALAFVKSRKRRSAKPAANITEEIVARIQIGNPVKGSSPALGSCEADTVPTFCACLTSTV